MGSFNSTATKWMAVNRTPGATTSWPAWHNRRTCVLQGLSDDFKLPGCVAQVVFEYTDTFRGLLMRTIDIKVCIESICGLPGGLAAVARQTNSSSTLISVFDVDTGAERWREATLGRERTHCELLAPRNYPQCLLENYYSHPDLWCDNKRLVRSVHTGAILCSLQGPPATDGPMGGVQWTIDPKTSALLCVSTHSTQTRAVTATLPGATWGRWLSPNRCLLLGGRNRDGILVLYTFDIATQQVSNLASRLQSQGAEQQIFMCGVAIGGSVGDESILLHWRSSEDWDALSRTGLMQCDRCGDVLARLELPPDDHDERNTLGSWRGSSVTAVASDGLVTVRTHTHVYTYDLVLRKLRQRAAVCEFAAVCRPAVPDVWTAASSPPLGHFYYVAFQDTPQMTRIICPARRLLLLWNFVSGSLVAAFEFDHGGIPLSTTTTNPSRLLLAMDDTVHVYS